MANPILLRVHEVALGAASRASVRGRSVDKLNYRAEEMPC
jgi:hypothetical protein